MTVGLVEEYKDVFSGLGKLREVKGEIARGSRRKRRCADTEKNISTTERKI